LFGKNKIFDSSEIVAIGDIHGESLKLKKIIDKLEPFLSNKKCHIVFCGDYFDRGPDSPGVLEILSEFKKKYLNQVFLIMGNHEQMVYETIFEKKPYWAKWTHKTLDQFINRWDPEYFFKNKNIDWYDLKNLKIIEELSIKNKLLSFLQNLIPYYESDSVICTHAPIDFRLLKDSSQGSVNFLDRIDLRWSFIAECDISDNKVIEKYLICGHQADLNITSPRIYSRRSFIDTGCGLNKLRPLTAFMYPSKNFIQEF
jgi:hypothetical protein